MRRKARRSDAPGLSAFVDFMSLISAGGLLSVGGDLSPSFRMRNSARMSGEDSSPRILELGSAVAGAECNTVIELKLEHHAA